MKFAYDLTYDDYYSFNKYQLMNTKEVKRARIIMLVLWALFPIFVGLIVLLIIGISLALEYFPLTVVWIAVCIGVSLFFIYTYASLPRFVDARLKKFIKTQDFSNDLGYRKVEIDEDGIFSRTKTGEGRLFWNGITKFVSTDEYYYLFKTDHSAFILPIRVFQNSEEEDNFLKEVENHINRI